MVKLRGVAQAVAASKGEGHGCSTMVRLRGVAQAVAGSMLR
jgi:hypothetical protein